MAIPRGYGYAWDRPADRTGRSAVARRTGSSWRQP